MSSIEPVSPWTLEMTGKDEWAGVGCFITYSANASGYARKYHNRRIHAGTSGPKAPRVRRVRIFYCAEGLQGLALLVCKCETPREPGKAKVRSKVIGLPYTEDRDLDGKTMGGSTPAPDLHSANGKPDGIHTWKSVRGSATRRLPVEQLIISTAYHAAQFRQSKLAALYDHVNSKDMKKLNCKKGTLWLRGAELSWEFGDSLVYVQYLLWKILGVVPTGAGGKKTRTRTWADVTTAQKGVWLVTRQPEFTYSAATNKYTMKADTAQGYKVPRVKVFVPMERYKDGDEWKLRNVDPEPRRALPEADLRALDSMIQWPTD